MFKAPHNFSRQENRSNSHGGSCRKDLWLGDHLGVYSAPIEDSGFKGTCLGSRFIPGAHSLPIPHLCGSTTLFILFFHLFPLWALLGWTWFLSDVILRLCHFCGFSQEPTPVKSEKLSPVCRAQAASPSGPFAHSARGCLSPSAPSGTR